MYKESDYQQLLKDADFKEEKVFAKYFNSGVFFVEGRFRGKRAILKVVSKDSKKKIKGMLRERAADQVLQRSHSISGGNLSYGEVFTIGQSENFVWEIREFISGDQLSEFGRKEVFLLGYDTVRDKFFRNRDHILTGVAENLTKLRQITSDSVGEMPHELLQPRFEPDCSKWDVANAEKLLAIKLDEQVGAYNSFSEDYLDKSKICAISGDLVPANIIIDEKINVSFCDLEWFGFDNYMMDPALLWLFLWRYKDWQAKLIELTIKNKEDEECFRASVIRIILSGKWYEQLSQFEASDRQPHPWHQYLIAAGNSYDKIIH